MICYYLHCSYTESIEYMSEMCNKIRDMGLFVMTTQKNKLVNCVYYNKTHILYNIVICFEDTR